MAELVSVRTGQIDPSTPGAKVPAKDWKHLLSARRRHCNDQFQHDCKELLFFIDDGRANSFFGYTDETAYWRDGLCLEPEAVPFAENYLRTHKARLEAGIDGKDWREIPFGEAAELGGWGGDHGNPRLKGQFTKAQGSNRNLGRGVAYILARLDRDGHTELAAKVRAGTLSANAAAIKAGFRKKPVRRCPQCGHEW